RNLHHMSQRQPHAAAHNSHKNGNDDRKYSTNKSKGQQWLLISGKLEELDSEMVHQDWSADMRKRCRAALHLPPAGLHGGAQKVCQSFSLALTPPLFAEPIRRA
ncbi:hypothetical protein XENOCAPTIV_028609, partial [Xenoophorus captivus]